MKTKIYTVVALLLICAVIIGGVYLYQKSIDDSYNNAISLIHNCSYEEALESLEKANNNIKRKSFVDDVKYNDLEKVYKNTIPLYAYALSQIEYNSEKKSMAYISRCLTLIPENYNGELSGEINAFKGNFKIQYDEFLNEQTIQTEKSNQEFYEKLKTKIPYEGMSEWDINKTVMGKYHDRKKGYAGNGYTYYWKTNSGEVMMAVACKEGKVTSVSRYGEEYFWTEDNKPIWDGKSPYAFSNSKSQNKSKHTDMYNVNNYNSADDFYDDNFESFEDYYDAVDYYNKYHEDQ